VVMLPDSLVGALREQLASARLIWVADMESGHSGVEMPGALDRKYPRAARVGPGCGSFRKRSIRSTRAAV
jgi:hypothetical protein